jgi:uncharacterized OsmC-like protein
MTAENSRTKKQPAPLLKMTLLLKMTICRADNWQHHMEVLHQLDDPNARKPGNAMNTLLAGVAASTAIAARDYLFTHGHEPNKIEVELRFDTQRQVDRPKVEVGGPGSALVYLAEGHNEYSITQTVSVEGPGSEESIGLTVNLAIHDHCELDLLKGRVRTQIARQRNRHDA